MHLVIEKTTDLLPSLKREYNQLDRLVVREIQILSSLKKDKNTLSLMRGRRILMCIYFRC